jgi:hypothetical protein
VPAGSISADVVLAGTSTVAIGPATLNLAAGSDTIVYAIGSASDKSLSLVTQTIDGLGGSPTGVPAGSGGAAAPSDPVPFWVVALAGLGVLVACVSGGGLYVQRRRAF